MSFRNFSMIFITMNEEYIKICPSCQEKITYGSKSAWKVNRYKVCVKCSNGAYTKEEEKFLIENYSKLGRSGCAKTLNRSEFSIGTKTTKMGLSLISHPTDDVNNKMCRRCDRELNKSEFFNDKNRKDGKYPICKDCTKKSVNTEKRKKYYKNYIVNKMKSDPIYKLRRMLRKRFKSALKAKGVRKNTSAIKIIGCSIQFLKQHLESKFKQGMTWENYGQYGWHIDHIKPCALFDLSKEDEQKKCFHYTNLQPLWANENLSKWKHFQT